jgi:hypothetical protein
MVLAQTADIHWGHFSQKGAGRLPYIPTLATSMTPPQTVKKSKKKAFILDCLTELPLYIA